MKTIPRDDNNVPLQGTYSSVGNGKKTVLSAGTAVQLSATSVECKRIDITALPTNTNPIAVGSSTVLATVGSESGALISPLGSYTLYVTDLSLIYIDAQTSGEGVTYTYFN